MSPSKYRANRNNADGTPHGYASRKEARIAGELAILAKAGKIFDLKEQVRFLLVEGRNGIRGITYVADFTYVDGSQLVVADVKGYKTAEYKLKKKMMALLLNIDITEL